MTLRPPPSFLVVILLFVFVICGAAFAFQPAAASGGLQWMQQQQHKQAQRLSKTHGCARTKRTALALANALEGEPMELCDETANQVIEEIRDELGTIFGYDPKSQEVGITGAIELVEVSGPEITVKLTGRFWHATDTVMMRVESFIKTRIPEVMTVTLSMEDSDIKDDNRLNTAGDGPKRLF